MASGLYLFGNTDKLRLISSSAAALDVVAGFVDVTPPSSPSAAVLPATIKQAQLTKISSATTTDIVATPTTNDLREVKYLTVYNADASLSCDVSVVLDRSATAYVLWKVTLAPGEALEFSEATGFYELAAASRLNMVKYVTADSVHATAATFADITGLTFPVISGRNYTFLAHLTAITNAVTTGAQFGVGGVAMNYLEVNGVSSLLANGGGGTAATFSSGRATAINTAVCLQTTGDATNSPHWLAGGFSPSASGTFAIRATSEVSVAAGLTVRKGSWAWVRESDN